MSSEDNCKIDQALKALTKKTKSLDEVTELFKLGGFQKLYKLLSDGQGVFDSVVLSILANCSNLDQNWRTAVSI